eukprot:Selendium_serpulae@DN5154_c1_g1_i2.p1
MNNLLMRTPMTQAARLGFRRAMTQPRYMTGTTAAKPTVTKPTMTKPTHFTTSGVSSEASKNAAPETPLHIYNSTPAAMHSIMHRMIVVNVLALVWVADSVTAILDF